MFLVHLLQKLIFILQNCKNMRKIENRGCHGKGREDQRIAYIFVHHSTEVKNRQSFRKIYLLFPDPNGGCLISTENDSAPCFLEYSVMGGKSTWPTGTQNPGHLTHCANTIIIELPSHMVDL